MYNRSERSCYTTKRTPVPEDIQSSGIANNVANTFEIFEIADCQPSLEEKLSHQLNSIKSSRFTLAYV